MGRVFQFAQSVPHLACLTLSEEWGGKGEAQEGQGVGHLSFEHVLAPSSVCGALCCPGGGCWISQASRGGSLNPNGFKRAPRKDVCLFRSASIFLQL